MDTNSDHGDRYFERSIDALLLAVEGKRAGIANPSGNAMQQLLEFAGEGGQRAKVVLDQLELTPEARSAVTGLLSAQYETNGRLISIQLQMAALLLDRLSEVTGQSPTAVLQNLDPGDAP